MTRYLLLNASGAYAGDFANAQDLTQYPAGYTLTAVADTDSRIVAQQTARAAQSTFRQALAAGLAITCSVTTALSATYGTAMQDEINLTGIQAAISAGQAWPGYLRDVTGAKHTMTNAQFTAIAEAVLAYVAGWDDWLANTLAGGTPTQPSNSVTLAI